MAAAVGENTCAEVVLVPHTAGKLWRCHLCATQLTSHLAHLDLAALTPRVRMSQQSCHRQGHCMPHPEALPCPYPC